MARNEEKAQSMLHRFRDARAAELGFNKNERRPYLASECRSLPEAEKWRRQIINEISRKVTQIQNSGLSDYQVRDMNDEINKLIREKGHWERQIKDLGGPDYRRIAPRIIDNEGKSVPGNRGYKYFGRARELPGVKELFEVEAAQEVESKSRYEMYKNVNADYYGYRDEDDGILLEYEEKQEKELRARLEESNDLILVEYDQGTAKGRKRKGGEGSISREPASISVAEGDVDNSEVKFIAHVDVPSQKDVEGFLVRRRKQDLFDKYVSEDLEATVQETKELTGRE
ncbi:pre-mRNA-splicing factor ISY1 [Basidiobolus meristosporus CBS 931.73]|uniref:Pre-mRNA-splicing factor ISY1 n=1 Tax=Basidiobolus meristosporus CBS 931.73 TaxID=1314790 RepID=A0A1Y1Z4B8_9FUNG|nr:pre-mRNA-splicing factor ISY1 [Basidiobolus meristosporus CBS 931.73]|eukprot:ORY04837.1 pre-mRNA-splicing factor ISY1 [Basidiobolus meristosporus CBS 931.73]